MNSFKSGAIIDSDADARQFRPLDGALTSFFSAGKVFTEKAHFIYHIIYSVEQKGMKMMGLMDLTKVSSLHCVQWLRIAFTPLPYFFVVPKASLKDDVFKFIVSCA